MRDYQTIQNDNSTGHRRDGTAPRIPSGRFRPDGGQSNSEQFVLVGMSDFWPGKTLRTVGQLPTPITVQLLRLPNKETVSVLSRPDEYTGYVTRAEYDELVVDSPTTLFTRETLETGRRYELVSDGQVFSERLHLFRSTVRERNQQEEEGRVVPSR